jgi:hypothetical protein
MMLDDAARDVLREEAGAVMDRLRRETEDLRHRLTDLNNARAFVADLTSQPGDDRVTWLPASGAPLATLDRWRRAIEALKTDAATPLPA